MNNNALDLDTARIRKMQLEQSISELLNKFSHDTGLYVTSLEIDRIDVTAAGSDSPEFLSAAHVHVDRIPQ